jgi:hypothetical protein
MADTSQLVQALAAYGRESTENLVKLRRWRDEAIDELAKGKGAQLISGSGTGLNFSMSPTTTIADWFRSLQSALEQVGNGRRTTALRIIF